MGDAGVFLESCAEIQRTHYRGDAEIKAAIRRLQKFHGPKNLGQATIDYNSSDLRCAYLHLYAGVHSLAVKNFFSDFLTRSSWKVPGPSFKICTVGGGPGCEAVGLLRALGDGALAKVEIHNLDRSAGWGPEFLRVLRKEQKTTPVLLRPVFHECDLLRPLEPPPLGALRDADLVTMVKFVSSFTKTTAPFRDFLKCLLFNLKPGALLYYVDGNGDKQKFEMLSVMAKECGLVPLYGPRKVTFKTPPRKQYGQMSLNLLNLRTVIWQKSLKTQGPSIQPSLILLDELFEDFDDTDNEDEDGFEEDIFKDSDDDFDLFSDNASFRLDGDCFEDGKHSNGVLLLEDISFSDDDDDDCGYTGDKSQCAFSSELFESSAKVNGASKGPSKFRTSRRLLSESSEESWGELEFLTFSDKNELRGNNKTYNGSFNRDILDLSSDDDY